MPLQHDTVHSIGEIFNEVQSNLYDAGLRWYSIDDIMAAIQEVYNKVVAIMCPIERSTFIPQVNQPYYNLRQIPDFMYVSGVFNPSTNLWLEGLTYKQMKATYQTYLAIGQPKWVNIVDLYRILVWPYLPGATGVLYVIYKGSAPIITLAHTPILPHSVGGLLLEYLATGELLEQAREFKKAQLWFDRALKPNPRLQRSLWDHCRKEIQANASMDREAVLEPYRWIFHGGQMSTNNWITGETPAGTLDGNNNVFTLAQVPNPSNSLLLTKNGIVLYSGLGYTINGQTITFNTGYIPQVDGDIPDALRAWYQVN